MAGWRSRFDATLADDDHRSGRRVWEFTEAASGDVVWTVFRTDGGMFPVFSADRGQGPLPSPGDLEAMTVEVVLELLSSAGLPDQVGWIARNIAAALLLASCDVLSWEGEEWALESDGDDVALAWAMPGDVRVPYNWLRARCRGTDRLISGYQDDTVFGLAFPYPADIRLPDQDWGLLRSRTDIDLVRGPLRAVDVTYDTTVEECRGGGLVTEVLLHGDARTTLLIAAEAYSRDRWCLHDESVVALPSTHAADSLEWIPRRPSWSSPRREVGPGSSSERSEAEHLHGGPGE